MAAKNGLLNGLEVIPETLRDNEGRRAIMASPKLQKLISKAHATLEGNVRLFLEEHCGVYGAMSLETPMEDLKRRLQIMNIEVRHVNVQSKPQLSGTWIIKGGKPLVSFPDPKLKGDKLLPQMMIKLQDNTIRIAKDLKGIA